MKELGSLECQLQLFNVLDYYNLLVSLKSCVVFPKIIINKT